MSSMNEANSFEEIIEAIRRASPDLEKELIIPNVLGPITVEALTNLKGWVYDLFQIGFPGTEPVITAGGPPVNLVNYTDQKGWIILFNATFRNPFGTLTFQADSFNFTISPLLVQVGGITAPNNTIAYATVFNPVTPFGPLYGFQYSPAYFIPFERRVNIDLSLPAASPIAQTTVFSASVGRIHIIDERTFIRSLKKFSVEQMTGRRIDRFP